jgi:hypothetical protein
MIGTKVKVEPHTSRVAAAADRATFKNLGHAAARVMRDARAKFEKSAEPSEPGQPPHTRKGQMPRSIRFDVSRPAQSAVIGPRESIVGESGAAHELGETFHDDDFVERPFMLPALEDNVDRFASDWGYSIGE